MKGTKSLYNYCIENNMEYLLQEWDYNKNRQVTPKDVSYGSSKKVIWKCSKNITHEWSATIKDRSKKRGCPYCNGQKVSIDNSLATINPELAKEWHLIKNVKLTPHDVTANSGKKVWWKCKEGHEWEAIIYSRNKGNNCPYCNKEKQTSFPEQAIYYYIKQMFPNAINSYKVEWLGKMELDIYIPSLKLGIEYDGYIFHNEKNKKNDEYKNKLCTKNNIKLIRIREKSCVFINMYNHYLIQTEYNDNYDYIYLNKMIENIISLINKLYNSNYFTIVKIEEDNQSIYNLFLTKRKENSLLNKYPDIAKEWNYEKNYPLTPDMFSYGSGRKVWWKCERNHEWESIINSRTKGKSCPYCSNQKVCIDNSLGIKKPNLIKEWNPIKNGDLTPYNITISSNKSVWWLCSNCKYEYKRTVYDQTRKDRNSKCPNCKSIINPK